MAREPGPRSRSIMPSADHKSKKWPIPFEQLDGRFVRLEPFVPELKAEVRAAIDCDPETWAIMPVNPMGEGFEKYWSATCGAWLDDRMAYAIRQRADARVIGMSTLLHGARET
jgi:N-acetyltransferase